MKKSYLMSPDMLRLCSEFLSSIRDARPMNFGNLLSMDAVQRKMASYNWLNRR